MIIRKIGIPNWYHNAQYMNLTRNLFINHFIEKTYQKYKRENEISSVLSKLIVILGRYDFAVPVTSWDGYEIDSAIFEKSSHYPMIEEAEAFTEKLIDRMRAT
jgi:hypothetical protein